MPSLLDQLDRRESLLMMYIAGELSADELKEVERRLSADPGLSADLERLRSTHDAALGALAQLDAIDPLPVDPSIAVKRVGDMLRQRMAVPAARRARPAAKAPAPYDVSRRLVGWAAVAAAVAVAASVAPQLLQLRHSGSSQQAAINPSGGPPDRGLEIEINRLAFDKWAHPDDDAIDALADETEDADAPRAPKEDAGPAGSVALNGEAPVFDVPLDLPESGRR